MNYRETYFELDSEEATHSHPLLPIVTLSVVCTLKGACQYTVQRIKATHVYVKMMLKGSKEPFTVLIVTHVTQVERVESGVCSFYATLHTE